MTMIHYTVYYPGQLGHSTCSNPLLCGDKGGVSTGKDHNLMLAIIFGNIYVGVVLEGKVDKILGKSICFLAEFLLLPMVTSTHSTTTPIHFLCQLCQASCTND